MDMRDEKLPDESQGPHYPATPGEVWHEEGTISPQHYVSNEIVLFCDKLYLYAHYAKYRNLQPHEVQHFFQLLSQLEQAGRFLLELSSVNKEEQAVSHFNNNSEENFLNSYFIPNEYSDLKSIKSLASFSSSSLSSFNNITSISATELDQKINLNNDNIQLQEDYCNKSHKLFSYDDTTTTNSIDNASPTTSTSSSTTTTACSSPLITYRAPLDSLLPLTLSEPEITSNVSSNWPSPSNNHNCTQRSTSDEFVDSNAKPKSIDLPDVNNDAIKKRVKVKKIHSLPLIYHDRPRRTRSRASVDVNRWCLVCMTNTTPEWRRGPSGPRTLCNACGLRYSKKNRSGEKSAGVPKIKMYQIKFNGKSKGL